MGDRRRQAIRVQFDAKLNLESHATKITNGSALPPFREQDEAFRLRQKGSRACCTDCARGRIRSWRSSCVKKPARPIGCACATAGPPGRPTSGTSRPTPANEVRRGTCDAPYAASPVSTHTRHPGGTRLRRPDAGPERRHNTAPNSRLACGRVHACGISMFRTSAWVPGGACSGQTLCNVKFARSAGLTWKSAFDMPANGEFEP